MRSSIMMAYLHPVLIPITWFLSRPNGISDLFGDVSATVLRPRRKSEFDFARYFFSSSIAYFRITFFRYSTIKKLDSTSSRGSSFYLHKAAGSCIKAKGDLELKSHQPSSPLLLTPQMQHWNTSTRKTHIFRFYLLKNVQLARSFYQASKYKKYFFKLQFFIVFRYWVNFKFLPF